MNWKKLTITFFRVAIGWHFLYEGLSKLWIENWSAQGYLANATGPFAGFYHWMASSETLMSIIDPVNIAALILIGLALFLGIAIRVSAISGVVLLLLYYFAYPPLGGLSMGAAEGNIFIVNKNLIEALALITLFFLKEKGYGIYALPYFLPKKNTAQEHAVENDNAVSSRREALKNLATLPALGILGW
ncbi:MAG: DoxX family membrane protein, partial [Prolixibacteraceae bacterium]